MTSNIGIVVTAENRAQQTLNQLLQQITQINRVVGLLGSAFNRLKISAQFYISYRIFSAINEVLDAIANAIPTLITRGDQWLAVLDKLQDVTGMTAAQVSKLAFAAKVVGLDVENLGRDMSYMARNAVENADALRKFGIEVRDNNGQLKGAWEIFNQIRSAMSRYGRQFLSTAAAQRVFSEGGRNLLDLLTLTDRQWQRLMQQAKDYGAVMTQAAISGAEAWRRAQNLMQTQIDIIGARILGGIAPVLIALTSGVTKAIQDNMTNIVNFVQRVVVVIAGFISGLLGFNINLNWVSKQIQDLSGAATRGAGAVGGLADTMDDAAAGTDRATRAIDRQSDALDRQIARLDRIQERRQERREHEELMQDIADARRELAELRSEAIFESGMSEAEAELARQAHAQDIIDAEKKVADARRAHRDWERDQEIEAERDRLQRLKDALSQQSAAIGAAGADMASSLSSALQSVPDSIGKGVKQLGPRLKADLKSLLDDVKRMGQDTANTIMDLIFGPRVYDPTTGKVSRDSYLNGGGLIGGFGRLLKMVNDLATALEAFWKWITGIVPPEVKAGIVGAARTGLPGIQPKKEEGGPSANPQEAALTLVQLLQRWLQGGGETGATTQPQPQSRFGGTPAASPALYWDQKAGGEDFAFQGLMQDGQKLLQSFQWIVDNNFGIPSGGFDLSQLGVGGVGGGSKALDPLFRSYLGGTSPVVQASLGTKAATTSVATNTMAIADGEVGTVIGGWKAGDLGTKIEDWRAGQLGVDNRNFGTIGTIQSWQAGNLPVSIKSSFQRYNPNTELGLLRTILTNLQHIADYTITLKHAQQYGAGSSIGVKVYGESHAAGTRYVGQTGLAMLHQGEAVLPVSQVRRSSGAGGGGTFTIQLDAKATRDFLRGRPINSSTRPLTGT